MNKQWLISLSVTLLWGSLFALNPVTIVAQNSSHHALYVRNREVTDAQYVDGDYYVEWSMLSRYFSAADVARLKMSEGRVTLDGKPLMLPTLAGQPQMVPLMAVGQALGFTKKHNSQLQAWDLLSPQSLQPASVKSFKANTAMQSSRDYRLSENLSQVCLSRWGQSQKSDYSARVERIGQKLVPFCRMPSLPWHFYCCKIINDATGRQRVNAFTYGPGFVFVTEALMDMDLNDSELAGVLAHEICHGTNRDQDQRIGNIDLIKKNKRELDTLNEQYRDLTLRMNNLAKMLNGNVNKVAADGPDYYNHYRIQYYELADQREKIAARLKTLVEETKTAAAGISSQKQSHSDEIDADLQSLRLCTNAGFSPYGLRSALLKLRRYEEEKPLGYWPELDNHGQMAPDAEKLPKRESGYSHPPTDRRVQLIDQTITKWRQSGWR